MIRPPISSAIQGIKLYWVGLSRRHLLQSVPAKTHHDDHSIVQLFWSYLIKSAGVALGRQIATRNNLSKMIQELWIAQRKELLVNLIQSMSSRFQLFLIISTVFDYSQTLYTLPLSMCFMDYCIITIVACRFLYFYHKVPTFMNILTFIGVRISIF